MRLTLHTLLFLLATLLTHAQNEGSFSGNLQAQSNFFQEDSLIGAFNTPQYDRQLYSADAWLNLNYSNWGFDVGVRFDLFNNSNLLNPQSSYTDQGIGRWFVHKSIDKLDLSAGYLYDQIGSGIIFRAYQERPLLIDNALYGIRLEYELLPDLFVKGFTGKQKRQFETYNAVIRGGSIEGFLSDTTGVWSIAPGFGVVARTFDDETVNQVVSAISTYTPIDSIGANYNTYAFSLYNTLTWQNFSWYVEAAYKTPETIFNPFADKLNWNGTISQGKLINEAGTVFYSTLSYGGKGLGIILEGKHTKNFNFRTTPFTSLNEGVINFLPPMSRINTYRLTARYAAAAQELGEQSALLDVTYSPNRTWRFYGNASIIDDLDGSKLYREFFTSASYRYKREWTLTGGLQIQSYNQERYEGKPEAPMVQTITPFAEFLYKIDRKKSVRSEVQWMNTAEDFGSWLFGLVEFTLSPSWTFTASDMFNYDPKRTSKAIHYPRFDVFYTHKTSRFSLSYIKQVEGVVCSGGICRLEPAFSGVRLTVDTQF